MTLVLRPTLRACRARANMNSASRRTVLSGARAAGKDCGGQPPSGLGPRKQASCAPLSGSLPASSVAVAGSPGWEVALDQPQEVLPLKGEDGGAPDVLRGEVVLTCSPAYSLGIAWQSQRR